MAAFGALTLSYVATGSRCIDEPINERKLSMKSVSELILLVILLCVLSPSSYAQSQDNAVINKFISSQERELGGDEYRNAREIRTGDLNHDGISDVAVSYTMESMSGGNNQARFLAVFVRVKGRLVYAAHTDTELGHLKLIRNGAIYIDTLEYGANDPRCCPSKKGSVRFVLNGNKLRKI